jgi:DNA-binding LacI/PurR family transcriptional regulator
MSWKKIADDISGRIASGEYPPGLRLESEEELAARVGVSRHTAHRALHELQRQGLVVRQRRWGTVVADRTAEPAKGRIAYLVDWTGNLFQSEVISDIEHALDESTRLVVATSRNDHEREAEQLVKLQGEVDGIICYPCDGDVNADVFKSVAESGFPLVLIDRAPRGCEDFVVLTDNVAASKEAVEDLIRRGHQRIAFFGTNNPSAQSIRERFMGYRIAAEGLGYATKPYERWIPVHLDLNDESMVQSVTDALVAMRCMSEPPTAAFCAQDWLATALLEACTALGLEVGVDFGIATYNDFGDTFFRQPWRLDRVVQQMDLVSQTAVERLRSLMGGEQIARGPVRVPAKFIPAETARAVLSSSLSAP